MSDDEGAKGLSALTDANRRGGRDGMIKASVSLQDLGSVSSQRVNQFHKGCM